MAGEADILLCTDAASEGLNFQFCGALVNYDMPWNPMRVEQRIGRIDRLGQEFPRIRIINLHYEDTVETDVYMALRHRINLFARFVGRLQPILARVPQYISTTVLATEADREHRRLQIESEISSEQRRIEQQAFDLDAMTEAEVEEPQRPAAPYSLEDLRLLMLMPGLVPPELEIRDGTPKYATLIAAGLAKPIRVTADAEFYDEHPENSELWSPGSRTFPPLEPTAPMESGGSLGQLLEQAERVIRGMR